MVVTQWQYLDHFQKYLISVEVLPNLVDYFQLTLHVQGVLPFELEGVTFMLQSQVDDEPMVADNCQTPTKNSRKALNASQKENKKYW